MNIANNDIFIILMTQIIYIYMNIILSRMFNVQILINSLK